MTDASIEKRALIDRTTWVRFIRAIKNFATSEVGGRGGLLFLALLAFLLLINALNVLNSYVGRDFMTAIEHRDMPVFVRERLGKSSAVSARPIRTLMSTALG